MNYMDRRPPINTDPHAPCSSLALTLGIPQTGGTGHRRAPNPGASRDYLIWSKIENTGRYSAMIIPPITTPIKAIIRGSMSEVSASVVVSTSAS